MSCAAKECLCKYLVSILGSLSNPCKDYYMEFLYSISDLITDVAKLRKGVEGGLFKIPPLGRSWVNLCVVEGL